MPKFSINIDLTKKWNKDFTIYAKNEAEAEEKLEELIDKYYDDTEYEICCCEEE